MTDLKMVKAENLIRRKIGDEIAVVRDDGLGLHILSKTTAIIWEMCNGENTVEDIINALCERFDVSYDEASADTREMIQKLADQGLLKQAEGGSGK